jgi:hypothetical protein
MDTVNNCMTSIKNRKMKNFGKIASYCVSHMRDLNDETSTEEMIEFYNKNNKPDLGEMINFWIENNGGSLDLSTPEEEIVKFYNSKNKS